MTTAAAANYGANGSAQTTGGRDPYAPSGADQQRAQAMAKATDAYAGTFHGGDEQWPLKWDKGTDPNPNVIINFCGPACDADVAWLFGESVSINGVASDPTGDSDPSTVSVDDTGANTDATNASDVFPEEAQDYLDAAWGASAEDSSDDDKMALLQQLATNGAITGHAWLKLDWDEDAGMDYPEIVVLDSQQVRVICDPLNVKYAVCYIIEYKTEVLAGTFRQVIEQKDAATGAVLKRKPRRNQPITWQITDFFRRDGASLFEPLGPPLAWDYSWPPIDGCPHLVQPGSYYGRNRIPPNAIHLNEVICLTASNEMTITIRNGHPILYTVVMGANQREIRYKPGTILQVSSDVKAVTAYGDLKDMMQMEATRRDDFDQQTHVPGVAFGRIEQFPRLPVSGVAYRLSFGALVADITKERRTYGALIRRVSQHMLELKNAAWKDLTVALGWQDPMPADDLQQAQVAQIMAASGASKTAVFKTLGLDYDEELQNRIQEAQDDAEIEANAPAPPAPLMPPIPGSAPLAPAAEGGTPPPSPTPPQAPTGTPPASTQAQTNTRSSAARTFTSAKSGGLAARRRGNGKTPR